MRYLKSIDLNKSTNLIKSNDVCIQNKIMTDFLTNIQFKFNIILIINFIVCLFLSMIIASVLRFFITKKVSYKEDYNFNRVTIHHRV